MLLRQLFSKKQPHPKNVIDPASAPLGYMLEARVLFDGAIAATATQAETSNPSDAASSSHPAQTANHSAEAASDNNASSDQNSATHDITTDVVVQAVAGETIRKEAVFIDTALTDYQTLVNNVPTGVDVFLLDSSQDGLTQMAVWAETHTGYDAIHILSHGNEGQVRLGNLTLDSATAEARSVDLAKLGAALTQDGDLLLYGCDIAQDTGKSFVSLLSQLTQADIAASTDLTGSASKGGNWQLETTVGSVEATDAVLSGIEREYTNLLVSPTLGTNSFSQFSGTNTFINTQPGIQSYDDANNGFTYFAYSTSNVSIQSVSLSGNQVLNTTVTSGGSLNYVGIKSTDGSEFKLSNVDLKVTGIYFPNNIFTLTGYKDGVAVSGATYSVTLTTTFNTLTLSSAFQNIDEVRVTNAITGNGLVVWDNIVTSPAVTGSDNAPSISGSATNPTYTENGSDVTLFSGVTADTNDSGQTFTGATFTVTNVADSTEYLNINGVKVSLTNGNSVSLGSGYGSASISLSAGTAVVSLSGATLSNADMGTLLSGMTYGNSSENPHTTARVVTLTQVTDSGTSDNSYNPGSIASTVAVVAVNDAPTDLALSNTTFGQSLGSNGIVGTLSATDVDSTTFTYSLVSGVGSTDNALFTLSGNSLQAVNATTMAAGTYSIRVQVSDGQATYEKVVTLTVADDIAPTFDTTPTITAPTTGGFTLNTDLNERGTVYYVVVPDGANAPSVTQVINGQTATGSVALASGNQVSSSAPYSQSLTLTGLAAATAYDVYVVAKDSAGNATVSVVKLDVTTAASSTAPTLSATGSNPVFIGGMAGSIDLFSGVSADTRDSGQTFSSLTLTVSNVSDSGEFINVGGNAISLATNGSGTLTGIGSYTVTRVGNTVTLQLNGMTASNTQLAGLVDGLRYGNSNSNVTAATRDVSLTAVSDSGSSNNTTSLSLTSSVNVLASNSTLYVTTGGDTGADATFGNGNTLQDDINDGGGLSLREALYWANNTPGIDRIVFQTDVTLSSSILSPTETLLIDGQNFTLNGGGYSGFQITSSSLTFAIQNLTLTHFTTINSLYSGGVLGINAGALDINFRLYNVDITGNTDDGWGNGMIDLSNIQQGAYIFDLDQVNIHDNTQLGGINEEGVIKLFVSAQQTLSLSLTNSAIYNNSGVNPPNGAVGVAGLYLAASGSTNAPNTHITLMNTTITGQDAGIEFGFTNYASSWVASVRNSIISGNTVDVVIHNDTTTNGSYTLNGGNNLIGTSVDMVSSSDPRLAATATNAINQGDRFYVTGDGDARGMDRIRQGTVDIGAYESQYASGTSAQVDLNGSATGSDYSATVSTGLNTGVPITDLLATLSQTDGDTRLWTLTLSLVGNTDGSNEYMTLSQQALLAAHAAGINVSGDGSQTVTLTGGATLDAFQTALRAIVYVNVATTPTAGNRTISVTANDDTSSSATSTLTIVTGNPPVVSTPIPAQNIAQNGSLNFTVPAGTFTDPDDDALTLSATLADGSALPSWLTFNPATGTFSGTPGNADVGILSIKVTATDPTNASVSTTFSLTVTNVNDAPVVSTTIPAQSVAQDSALNFTVPDGTFTDPDGDTLTFTATLADGSALPSWLTFNTSTGTFSGTPGNADVGSLSIKVTATDPSLTAISTTFTLTVSNVNDAPVVSTTIPAQSVAQDSELNFTVPAGTFSDPDGDTLTLSATLANGSPLPSWLTFNTATGTFSGTPGNSDVGSLSIKVIANDGDASVSTTFTLTITNVNDAPVVATPIPAQSVAQDSALNFTVPSGTFTDPDGDTLTYSATLADGSALPSWLSFNTATGTFSGTPANGDVGNLSIKVTASDGDASVSTTFSLTITNVNDAPVLATPIPAQTIAQGSALSFTVPGSTFSDPDGDTLTLSATQADGSALPSWLSFNPATGTFSGTPANGDIGTLSIRVTANDGDASTSTTFGLTISPPNEAPVVAAPIPAQSIAQDGSLNFTVPAGTFTDPDGDTLTLSATLANGSPLPSWISFNPATGTFSGTPANGDVGSLSIKVTANDGDASVSTTFSLTVTNVNDAPVVATPIPAQSIAQDGNLSFTVPAGTFTDPDGDTLTLSATLADGSALPSWLSFNPTTGTFSGTPANGDVGSLSIKVTANDGDASVSTTFSLTVTNVNDAPVVATPIPAQSIAQDGSLNFTVPAGTFTDPDGDTLTLGATLANGSPLPSWISFNPATGTFSGTPANGDVGSLSIKVTANDGDASVSTTFSLTVTNVNDAPVVATPIPAQSIAQDGNLSFTVPAGTFTDPDGDTLTLSATLADGSALPSWLSFNPTTGTFSGTPANGDVGSLSIKVTANDGDASVSTTFSLTVTNVNDAPVVATPIPAQSIAQDGSLNFTVPAGTFTDPDGDTLTLSATLANGSPLPSWLSFNPVTGAFSGTPANGDVGSLSIKVTANDGDASVSITFSLTVTNVNDAPVVSGTIPAQSVAQDGSLNFTVPAGTFADPDGDTLTLSATLADGSALPSWLSFNPATGTFSGTPANGDVGNLSIRVTANDGDASVSTTFSLTVTNVNDAPVVATPIPAQSIAQDGSLNFTVPAGTFTDPDGDTLTLSATQADGSALPSWLSFNPTTGTFSGSPGNGNVGNLVITVIATDGNNATVSTNFSLTVTPGIQGDPQFRATDGINLTPSASDARQSLGQDSSIAPPTLGGLVVAPSLGSFTTGNAGAPGSVMSAIFSANRQQTDSGTFPTSEVANTFVQGIASNVGVNFDSTLGSFPSFSKDPALGGTTSLAGTFSGIHLPSLTPMEIFSGGSWKDVPFNSANNTLNDGENSTERSVAFTPSLHRQLQQMGDAEWQRLAALEQALQDSGQQQG
ncbi:putative Ig domain-containing protein [Candidatus Symbiopectobacterium sp. NZEC135]|uniref:putative Ig domain-containing protein n=1 Tax=Candidatus Symbiopectobacterium sp. NZEC135 TaxID=2820471 RepID=UPI002226638A|nr:putative Ig domain-containing protein [Candidatus Symbiopectobacterium sp. NZEC135]MCW2479894.1 putative Ig domain-containing protein [Candidatus Symbiopectobacterium sp. NZEC135]